MSEPTKNTDYYAQLLKKNEQDFDPEKYVEIIAATKNGDASLRAVAFFALGNIMSHELLESDRETFLKGFQAVLDTYQDESSNVRFTSVVILSKIMDLKFLQEEEEMYMEGLDHLQWVTHDITENVAQKAKDTLELKKETLRKSIKENLSSEDI